jgi:hypothetical protein
MVQPANYNIDVQSPFQAFAQGAQLGTGLAEIQARRQAQEQDVLRQQQLSQEVQALNANPNPTAKDYQRLSFLLPPAQMKSVLDVFQAGSKEQQDQTLAFSGQVLSSFTSGQPQVGINLLETRAQAEENRGNKVQAKAYRDYAELARLNPNAAQKTIGIMLSSLPGGDKMIEATTKAQTAPATVSKAESEATGARLEVANLPTKLDLDNKNTRSIIQNRSDQLNLDRDRLTGDVQAKLLEFGQKETKLDESAIKIINTAVPTSIALEQAAGNTIDLANKIEQAAGTSGIAGKFSETLKSITGNQDAVTQLRNEYTRIRNSAAIKSLPPGVATDKDIELALKGIPPETANAATQASFLRGMAKMQQYEAASEGAKADWVFANGNLGRAKSDINIGGIKVPKGSSFIDFSRQFIDQKAKDLGVARANAKTSSGASYMKYANPAGQ